MNTLGAAKIKIIGIGGGGGNMINYLSEKDINNIELIAANTDAQALESSGATYKVQLGLNTTKGLGAGMKPEIGEKSANESLESISSMIDGSDLVFVSTGLGGGTGTGASPVIAAEAKRTGALTISIATLPFRFEGRKRTKLAKEGLKKLTEASDAIVLISNENLLAIAEKNLGMRDSFKLVDEVLSSAVLGISNLITSHANNDINLDFADVKTIMKDQGLSLMGIGSHKGDNSAAVAIKEAIKSPLLNNVSIEGAMGVLVHFEMHPDYPLNDISEAMNLIEDSADEDSSIIFGTSSNTAMALNEIKVTLIATGFEKEDIQTEDKKETVVEKKLNKAPIVINNIDKDDLDIPTYLREKIS